MRHCHPPGHELPSAGSVAAIKLLERIPEDAKRHQVAGSLGFVWSVRDINLAWNCVTHSALDAPTNQVFYNTLWG
ncbi:MAG: hypothetical protein Q8M07_23315 [Prosthecobacter sp.]|nr:hypothetical protein [Prosthecobacter sp.]